MDNGTCAMIFLYMDQQNILSHLFKSKLQIAQTETIIIQSTTIFMMVFIMHSITVWLHPIILFHK